MQIMELLSRFKKEDKETGEHFIYTEEQLMARLKFFIGICLALTLTGIVFVVLYSIIFVTQPLNAISPIDQKFFELIIPIATFLTGTLSGIMLAGNDKDLKAKALEAANKAPTVSPAPSTPPSGGGGFSVGANFGGASMSFNKPAASAFGAPAAPAFGASMDFGAAPSAPVMSSTGKPMPVQPDHPEI
jgi:hypothetical protein